MAYLQKVNVNFVVKIITVVVACQFLLTFCLHINLNILLHVCETNIQSTYKPLTYIEIYSGN